MRTEEVPTAPERRDMGSTRRGPQGPVIDERFLVERDLSDPAFANGFQTFAVKDLKHYRRDGVLKVGRLVLDDSGVAGPSLEDVGNVLIRFPHDNIEELLETGKLSDGRPFAVARPYSGTPLAGLIREGGRLELEGIGQLAEQVADALASAHSRGILHCDLRPANILVPEGDIGANPIRVVNFGAAWPIDSRGERLANVQRGSEPLHYAAPELLVALGHRSPASDVYSFSVLIYRLLTGKLPYAGVDRISLLEMISEGAVVPPSIGRTDLPGEAGALLLAGLSFEPSGRPSDVRDMSRRFVRLLFPPRGVALIAAQPPEAAPAEAEVPLAELSASIMGPKQPEPIPRSPLSEPRAAVSDRAIAWALIILLMAGALSIPIGQSLLKRNTTLAAADPVPKRPAANRPRHRITYKVQAPAAAGQPRTEKPGLSVTVDSPGWIYVLSEYPDQDGRPSFANLRPSAEAGPVESGKALNILVEPLPGHAELRGVWIVWSPTAANDLEAIVSADANGRVVNEVDRQRARHFLERHRNSRVEVKPGMPGTTILEGSGERIVHQIEPDALVNLIGAVKQ